MGHGSFSDFREICGRVFHVGQKLALLLCLGICIISADDSPFQEIHYGIIQGLHTVFFTGLEHGRDLECLSLPDQISHCRSGNHYFNGSNPALAVFTLEKGLGHNRPNTISKRIPDLLLLVLREDLDNPVHGLGCTRSMKYEVSQTQGDQWTRPQ